MTDPINRLRAQRVAELLAVTAAEEVVRAAWARLLAAAEQELHRREQEAAS